LAGHPPACDIPLHAGGIVDQIENWVSIITRQAIRRGTFSSAKALITGISDHIQHGSSDPKPFAWIATANENVAKVRLVQTHVNKLRRQQRKVKTPESRSTSASPASADVTIRDQIGSR
jgi:hypothetical protein